MSMKIAIVAPPYNSTSAGIMSLYLLNYHLLERGINSRIIVPHTQVLPVDGEIVVYPECFPGNMHAVERVVRYCCNYPGKLGGDLDFPDSEMMYYYSPSFIHKGRNPENILTVPCINENKFPWRPQSQRSGTCYLDIKLRDLWGIPVTGLPPDSIRITKDMDLEDLFSRIAKLITFDDSSINIEAALAGIDIQFQFNPKFDKPFDYGQFFDWSRPRESYFNLKEIYFSRQLPAFIKRLEDYQWIH